MSGDPGADRGEGGLVRLLGAIRLRGSRARGAREGEASFIRSLGQVGALGWTIVVPTLLGLLMGRWLDHRSGGGIFWSAPAMMAGLALGCWSAWKWMHRQ